MKSISIIGGGAWGRALAITFASKCKVELYVMPFDPDVNDTRIETRHDLNQIRDASCIFLVVPSNAIRDVCNKLKTILTKPCTLVICSKGVEVGTGKFMSEVVTELLPTNKIAILSGPNFASEISKGLPALTSIVSEDIALARDLANSLSTETFRLLPSTNVLIAQLFGTTKNVLAMLCGVARGLGLGNNFVASLITKGVNEMLELAKHKGIAGAERILEPAGIGDIFLTCNGQESRNQKFGLELVSQYLGQHYKDIHMTTTVESISTIEALQAWKTKTPILCSFAHELIAGKYTTQDEVKERFVGLVLSKAITL